MRSIIPKEGTPTAMFRGKRAEIDGTTFWLKGASPARHNDNRSPYNERAAYVLDRMLNLKMVPTTMLILVEGKVVSAQKWIEADRPRKNPSALLRVFDYIIENTDRHEGNWLVKDKKVWAIDNAYGFGTYVDDGRSVRNYYAVGITKRERAKLITRLEIVLADEQKIHEKLNCLIGKEDTDAVIKRMKQVLRVLAKRKTKEVPC